MKMHQNNALQPIDRHQWCLIRDHPPLPTICFTASDHHGEETGDGNDGVFKPWKCLEIVTNVVSLFLIDLYNQKSGVRDIRFK